MRTHGEWIWYIWVGTVLASPYGPKRELALTMTNYALRSLGVSDGQARLYVQASRDPEGKMARDRAPELRPRRNEDDSEPAVDRPDPAA